MAKMYYLQRTSLKVPSNRCPALPHTAYPTQAIRITNCMFSGNSGTTGGAIQIINAASVVVSNCFFVGG